ncbi:type I DNA topoisomerase, partial [Candidatus Neomarinimicrobiota bacterium]
MPSTQPKQSVVIVESPSKARTLRRVLGDNYTVEASVGHIRDLPPRKMGVDPDNGFQVEYEVPPEKKKVIKDLKLAVKRADAVYLATDPDREGEAISWHLTAALDIKVPTYRLVFHEVTDRAIHKAFDDLRDIDMRLVKAQETRRILDRLVGYEISPILWRSMSPGLSAGRVQSVAIRLVVERERVRGKFTSNKFWDIEGTFITPAGDTFTATLANLNGQRLVNGKDFDRTTGDLKAEGEHILSLEQNEANQWTERLADTDWQVITLEEKPGQSQPSPPFTTSTLQQAASREFRFTARRTMQVAQRLYEAGHITYMRTDSTVLSSEALSISRHIIKQQYGTDFLPEKPRHYKTKVKNAQEAHEAIRPAGKFIDPEALKVDDADMVRLYTLIYRRTLASQMTPARFRQTTVEITGDGALFQAFGKVIDFPGYLAAYSESEDNNKDKMLPAMGTGDHLGCQSLESRSHETKAAARYTEATLIRELESLGIGRPSTYASIMDTIQRREYVVRKGSTLVPTFTALGVVRLMEEYFSDLVDYHFTARMEDVLDEISLGNEDSQPYLERFYFGGNDHAG